MLNTSTRNLFFTGKGGVGKTTISSSIAIRLAESGKRVLLVSTDPASNLDEVLGYTLGTAPKEIPGVPGLWAMNIDPEQAAFEYRERMVAPYRGILPDAAIQSIEEQFSGACTVEIAAFDEFAKLLAEPLLTERFDHIVFDTAPTVHTLRLLRLPDAWSDFIQTNTTGSSCVGTLSGMKQQQNLYLNTLRSLGDATQTTVVLVTRLDTAALREADRTCRELGELQIDNLQLVVNGIFHCTDPRDPIAIALAQRGEQANQNFPASLVALNRLDIPLNAGSLLGVDALRNVLPTEALSPLPASPTSNLANAAHLPTSVDLLKLQSETTAQANELSSRLRSSKSLVAEIEASGRGVIMTMGKGGVGKTSLAAAIAIELASKGHKVRLTTTDPAAHVQAAVQSAVKQNVTGTSSEYGEIERLLLVDRIDPHQVTEAYRTEVLQTTADNIDASGRALLEEELNSPCTEEIAVFRAFAEAVEQGNDGFVVLDTAPTGHTILLLDAALAYHREVEKQSGGLPTSVERLLPRLRDPSFTKVIVVTLPESTPVHEAAQLQDDLKRAGISPFAWVINQSLLRIPVADPILIQRQNLEVKYVREVVEQHSSNTILIDWKPDHLSNLI